MKILSLIYIVAMVWIVSEIWRHPTHSDGAKALWTGVVIVFPFVGSLLWFAAGKRLG